MNRRRKRSVQALAPRLPRARPAAYFDMRSLLSVLVGPAATLALASIAAPPAAREVPPPADPQPSPQVLQAWGFDPAVLVADGRELLLRAPDHAIDKLFQVLLDSARQPRQAQVICALFDPDADRSLAGFNAMAAELDPAIRERYVLAIADLFVAATRHPPAPFDAAAARQALRQAGVRAALLNGQFSAGLQGSDPDARCRSAAMLLEAMAPRPLAERAAVTRLLLIEGLERLAAPL